MWKAYKLNACMSLVLILTVGTILLKFGTIPFSAVYPILAEGVFVALAVPICWIIHAYIKQLGTARTSPRALRGIGFLGSLLICLALNWLFIVTLPEKWIPNSLKLSDWPGDYARRLIGIFLLTVVTYAAYSSIYASEMLQKTQLENEQFKQAHLHAQLIALQHQLSPHFLFNSLNTLKNIATDTDTKRFVLQLSHIFRYVLSMNQRQVVPLSEELSFIDSYLYILRQRFGSAFIVSIDIPEKFRRNLIPPLSLQLLIENTIKHNALSPDRPMEVEIYVKGLDTLVISNTRIPKSVPETSSGFGLSNVNERFHLLFNRAIGIKKEADRFIVSLPLSQHERNNN